MLSGLVVSKFASAVKTFPIAPGPQPVDCTATGVGANELEFVPLFHKVLGSIERVTPVLRIAKSLKRMVGATGIEPVTPAV